MECADLKQAFVDLGYADVEVVENWVCQHNLSFQVKIDSRSLEFQIRKSEYPDEAAVLCLKQMQLPPRRLKNFTVVMESKSKPGEEFTADEINRQMASTKDKQDAIWAHELGCCVPNKKGVVSMGGYLESMNKRYEASNPIPGRSFINGELPFVDDLELEVVPPWELYKYGPHAKLVQVIWAAEKQRAGK